jgi:hypothetical protein
MNKRSTAESCLTYGSAILWILLPIAWALGAYLCYEWQTLRPGPDDELVTGEAVGREMTKLWSFVPRPKLVVTSNKAPEPLYAVLSVDGMNDIPIVVSFYYSEDPTKEIYLQQESSPLWFGLFFILAPVSGLLSIGWYRRRLQRMSGT